MKDTVTGRCSRQKSMETRSSQLVWRPTTQEAQNKAENVKEQKPDRIFVNEMFVEQSSSMAAATDPGRMRIMSREGSESRSRISKHMPSDQNQENMEEALDEQTSMLNEFTVVEPSSGIVTATNLQRRMSRVGESRRRTKRISLDMAVNSWSPEEDASSSFKENCFDVSCTLHKLSHVSRHFLLDNDECDWRSNPLFPGSFRSKCLRWNQSTSWEGEEEEEDAGAAEVPQYSPSLYVDMLLEIGYSQKDLLLHENKKSASNDLKHSTQSSSSPQQVRLQPIMHKDDIFPGNTKYLTPLRVRKPASEPCDYPGPRNQCAKLGSSVVDESQIPLKQARKPNLRVIGGSSKFSRSLDTRSIKKNKYPNAAAVLEVTPGCSSFPKNSALMGNCRGGLCRRSWIFHNLQLQGISSQIDSSEELSCQETKGSWEPQCRQRTHCKQVNTSIKSVVVVWEKCCLPKGTLGAGIQVLKNARKFNK
ncbi:unnamed protein product [Sphagnum compactum]